MTAKYLSKINNVLLYVVLVVVGMFNMFSPMITSGFSRMQPEAGDPIFNAFILEHTYKAFFDSSYQSSYLSPHFYYPIQWMLTHSDNLLGTAPIYWVFRVFFNWTLSFQLWSVTCVLLTYVSFVYFFRYLKIRSSLSAVGAFILTFGIPHVIQIWHPQLFPQFFTPLALLFLIKYLREPSLKTFNLLVLLTLLQSLSGYYLGWFLIFSFCLMPFVMPFFVQDELRNVLAHISQNKKGYIRSLLIWLGVFIVVWFPYIITSYRYRDLRDWENILRNLTPNLRGYFYIPEGTLFRKPFGDFVRGDLPLEQVFYLGVVPLIVTVLNVFLFLREKVPLEKLRFFQRLGLSFLIIFLLLNLLTLRFGDFSLWRFVNIAFPGADGIRYVSRVWVVSYVYLFISLLLWVENRLQHLSWNTFNRVSVTLLLVFAVVEHLVVSKPSFEKEAFTNDLYALQETLSNTEGCTVFYLSTGGKSEVYFPEHLKAMFVSMYTSIPTINGYSGQVFYRYKTPLTQEQIEEFILTFNTEKSERNETVCVLEKKDQYELTSSFRLLYR